ncbi:DEAD/DEAH box helicase family protein [Ruegeria arenilitoris]|uniref:DEAD/DEAH box helicase family protein n=1 Tax=Ruegeria arenilitoris TaxID=1173585 RepID=UPI00147AA212
MFSLPSWLRSKPRKIEELDQSIPERQGDDVVPKFGTNIDRSVIDLYRPHIHTRDCLIVTGYQDFLSSLSILIAEIPELKEPNFEGELRIRVSFGVDTANAKRVGRTGSVKQETKLRWLEKTGLEVEDNQDLMAILARRAIERGNIQLRVFDPILAQKNLGIRGDRLMHSKIVSSPIGAAAGSANFSRSGLYRNIEYADTLEAGSNDLQIERTRTAEKIWEASVDWTNEALEILDKLIKPVTSEDAMARMISEQRGFRPWRTRYRKGITGHTLFKYQEELVYEACSIVYEHGIAFVEAPTGSGKTEIGCHLAEALSETYSRVIPRSPIHDVARKNAAVIAPPKVIPSWERHATNSLKAVANTTLSKRNLRGAGDDKKAGLRLDQFGVLIVDESHTVTPSFEEPSKMAAAIELAPPSWNVCLSATLLGNRDVDWLAHMQEKRASIFMTPDYIQTMGELFDKERQVLSDIFGESLNHPVIKEPRNVISRETRSELAALISPFLTRRQRNCIGQHRDRSKHGYPVLANHGRPSTLKPTKPQRQRLDEIVALCRDLSPGGMIADTERSRFGLSQTRQSTQDRLYVRNLLNVLRVSATQAKWEMSHGAIGKQLRGFEKGAKSRKRTADANQTDMFSMLGVDPLLQAVKCDELTKKLSSRAMHELDEKRYEACLRIQEKHERVVFLAERTDTLEIFAEALSRKGNHTNFVVGQETKGEDRAVKFIFGTGPDSFERIDEGKSVESYFRPGGRKAPKGPASIFMTYKMAEGINLQSSDTLVLLGVTSNLKELIQGLGRIDRIDSAFGKVNYHLVDVPVGFFASDEKVTKRIENYRTLAGENIVDAVLEDSAEDAEAILQSVVEYLRSKRNLRDNNFHDVLSRTKGSINQKRYQLIEKANVEGTWGAELALLPVKETFTALHLKGTNKSSSFLPPRLLLLRPSKKSLLFVRDQVACARMLEDAYKKTRSMGSELNRMSTRDLSEALETVAGHLSVLTDWDLRPARVESLMKACAEFVSRRNGLDQDDQEMFGHLSLPAIEMICESWSRLLDPYWDKAKQEVRNSFAYEDLPKGYIALNVILEALEHDVGQANDVHRLMTEVIEEANEASKDHEPEITKRISVVFFSSGGGDNQS